MVLTQNEWRTLRFILAIAMMPCLAVAEGGCLPDSVDGSWHVTRVTKWTSCLGSRCKRGDDQSTTGVDYLTDPMELRDYLGVQCWPGTSSLWSQGFGSYVSWSSRGNRCDAHVIDRPTFVEQLQACAEDVSLSLLAFASHVQSARAGQRVSTSASLRFAILNGAGRVVIHTVTRQRWTRE